MRKISSLFIVLLVCSKIFAQDTNFHWLEKLNSIHFSKKESAVPISISGEARFFSVYRNMSKQYGDAISPKKSLAFTDYPLAGAGSGNSSGIPLINLHLQAQPLKNFTFSVAYSLSHDFNGFLDDTSKIASVRSNLSFGGTYKSNAGVFNLEGGGGVLWTHISPLTMYNLENHDNEFDRLPWDDYTNSFERYQNIYNDKAAGSGESYEDVAFQGFALSGKGLPLDLGFHAIYGRSWTSVTQERAGIRYPANTVGGKIEKNIQQHLLSFNYFNEFGDTDRVHRVADQRSIYTSQINMNYGKFKINAEAGMGKVKNPLTNGEWGSAFIVEGIFNKQITKIPLQIKLYNIGIEVASNVSSVYNSNMNAAGGGYNNDPKYDTQRYINVMEELGQYSNNRRGLSFKTEHAIKTFKMEFGYGLSSEIKNLYDTVLFQHRVNSFSRSRFNPWIQDGGPYGQVKSVFRRTYQTVAITDSGEYLKGFNALELVLKYSTQLFNKSLILKNHSAYNSVSKGVKVIPEFNDKAFVRTVFNQLTAFYQLSPKVSLIAFGAFQITKCSNQTRLSAENKLPVDQLGTGYGAGIDYDFSDHAGIYLRHRWMEHKDKNFVMDEFKGQETTIELKVFF